MGSGPKHMDGAARVCSVSGVSNGATACRAIHSVMCVPMRFYVSSCARLVHGSCEQYPHSLFV